MLSEKTIRQLFAKLKLYPSLEEILLNTRRLATLLFRRENLEFALSRVKVETKFETEQVKKKILTKSHRELGINKSTLWYQRKNLRETGSVRLYRKTKPYFE